MPLLSLLVTYLASVWLTAAQNPAAGRPAAAPPTTESFVVGVLRRDGNVIPFASFNGRDWDADWPAGLRGIELPISLDAVPAKWWGKAEAPSETTLWVNGARKSSMKLGRPAMMAIACSMRLLVTTDYRATEVVPPVFVQPYPKDGLVVSDNPDVRAIEDVTAADVRAKIATLLLDPFDKAEQRAVNEFFEWTHPVKRADRRKIPIEIEALYRAPMEEEGWSAYFVEAVKKYTPAPEDRGCGLVTSANGWVLVGPSKELVRIAGRITYCDRKGVSFFLPLGLIRANGHLYWVSQSSGYDHEFYNVTRPTSKDIRYEVSYPVAVCGR